MGASEHSVHLKQASSVYKRYYTSTSALIKCSGCEWNASAQAVPGQTPLPKSSKLEDSSSSNPASIRRWSCLCHACSGASCHFPLPTAFPLQFSWTVTKPGLNPFSRSPHPLHTLQHWLPKKDVPTVHYLLLIFLSPFTPLKESCRKYHMFPQQAERRRKFNAKIK